MPVFTFFYIFHIGFSILHGITSSFDFAIDTIVAERSHTANLVRSLHVISHSSYWYSGHLIIKSFQPQIIWSSEPFGTGSFETQTFSFVIHRISKTFIIKCLGH